MSLASPVASMKASMEAMEASVKVVEASMEAMEASMEAFTSLHLNADIAGGPSPACALNARTHIYLRWFCIAARATIEVALFV